MTTRLLHGTLEAHIFEAAHLPNLAGCPSCTPRFFGKLFEGHGEESSDKRDLFSKINNFFCCPQEMSKDVSEAVVGSTGLYATIDLGKTRVARTRLIKNEAVRPLWNEFFHVYCAHMISEIVFTVKKDHLIDATLIGRAHVPVEDVIRGTTVDRWIQLLDEGGQPIRRNAKIHVKLQFLNCSQDLERSLWIRSPNFDGVPYTYFKQREGCRVSLYQDAHVPDNLIPRIALSGGNYEPRRCWEDVFDAITNARHLIYITGWSLYTEISLVRDPRRPKQGGNISLGELLKRKAREGVRVLVLVWDDRTSVPSLKKDGLMATHDQDTADYFQNTEVHCVLCPREPGGGSSVVQGLQIYTMFTHHQKTLVVDSEVTIAGSRHRMILSFVGGIDLCDGRYDTPLHSLFRTLNTTHSHDFHQPNFTGASISKGGPREPWHDIHCKLEGPIAWDVLFNFEQRWNKQGMKGLLVDINSAGIISPTNTAFFPRDSESWNVQLFRSIDVGAATGFPQDPDKMARAGLVTGKDNIIERSIQDAYINAIRQAKNFIYIENQYFLGSSFGWKPDGIDMEEIGALHLIPKELSLKIVSKIKANERFTVYIVIPMWPEGIPESSSVQAILNWQKKTMEMMYTDITQALQASDLQADPKDYLSFFCLGNREVNKSGEYVPTEHPEPDTDYARAQEARRFMIYVHAKMMIVDDEYIIIGSANINQRSMDGARDTEIAMAAYQPSHLNGEEAAKGQIHGFRMALWFEHLATYNISYLRPQSLDCVRMINNLASENWRRYSSDVVQEDLPGHLLSYPISVNSNGTVTELGPGTFPDTKAHILGSKTDLPPILTT